MGKLERYFDDVARIRAIGSSRNNWVSVTREPQGEIDVRIRPGMLRRCTADEVAEEIRTGLLAVVADHRRQYQQLRIQYFGSLLGASRVPPDIDAIDVPDTSATRVTGWT